MVWFLVALVSGSIVYAAGIIAEFVTFLNETQPRIRQVEQDAAWYEEEAEAESRWCNQVRERIPGLQESVEQLQRQASRLREEEGTEQERQRRLEMEVYRRQIRTGRRR